MCASNQMFIALKSSRGMEYVMISIIHLFVNLTWEIAAPMRFSLIRVTDESKVFCQWNGPIEIFGRNLRER